MKKDHPNYASHLGVYAFIPSADGSQLLLIKKALGCYTGLLDFPGGTMDHGELLEETLKREVVEETNCHVTSHQHLATLSLHYPYKRNNQDFILRHIGVIYLAEITGTPREDATGDDSAGCVWMPIAEITLSNSTPMIVQALEHWKRLAG